MMKIIDTPVTHTLSYNFSPTGGVAGTSTTSVTWNLFSGFNALSNFYMYFEPLSWKLDLIGYLPTATSNFAVISCFPNDFATDVVPAVAP
jgi:hypothetical protein